MYKSRTQTFFGCTVLISIGICFYIGHVCRGIESTTSMGVQPRTVRNDTSMLISPNVLLNTTVRAYTTCKHIPLSPDDYSWAEEKSLYRPRLTDILDAADGKRSKMWIEGVTSVTVGDSIRLHIQLFDGHGKPRKTGGDMIRVWMKELSNMTSTVGTVMDLNNGSYIATLKTFWVGKPQIKAAIIQNLEVIDACFRRRYICPHVVNSIAKFTNDGVTEETWCDVSLDVVSSGRVCNLTKYNFGSPWFCGEPISKQLPCSTWTGVGSYAMYKKEQEELFLYTDAEKKFLLAEKKVAFIPSNIYLNVAQGEHQIHMIQGKQRCNTLKKKITWDPVKSHGYFFNKKWINHRCRGPKDYSFLEKCLINTTILLIGDSTIRQVLGDILPRKHCIVTPYSNLKFHHPVECFDNVSNYSLIYNLHPLPFNTMDSLRTYFKPFYMSFNQVHTARRAIVVVKLFAYILGYHSHVAFEALKKMKVAIAELLERNPEAFVVIYGPNAFPFRKKVSLIWKTEKYADVYTDMIKHIFKDMYENVVYLNALDMTIASEQQDIHPESYVVRQLVDQIFYQYCEYD